MDNHTFLVIRLTFGYLLLLVSSKMKFQYKKRYIFFPDLLVNHCRVVSQFWCSFITFPLYVIITQMGSRFKKSVVSENVRESLSGWKRRVKARQSTSSKTGLLSSSSTSTAAFSSDSSKVDSSSSNSVEGSSISSRFQKPSSPHLEANVQQGRQVSETLESLLCADPHYDIFDEEEEDDYHRDDNSKG